MDRLQKKCFIVSAGMHLLLALILFLSSAFSSSESKTSDITPLTFIPSILLESDIRGGGNPNVRPPPPSTPPPVAPAPARPEIAQAKLVPEPVKTREPEVHDPEPVEEHAEASLERKPRKPQISTKLISKPTPTANKSTSKANSSATEQNQALAARRELANRIGRAVADLGQGSAPVTTIEDFGPGGGGPAYAGYAAYVQAIYLSAWVPPEETASEAAVTKATVTIARDGTVTAHSITKRSGDSQVDSSVQRALERVSSIGRPFPEGMKDKERTYILKFDLTVKRGQA